ncbi:hypothetical protein OH686_15615 [Pseudomonas sp. SO81]|nr:hypothetical protein OH686_15615 [Pseudomonas sp. SO81]
MNCNRWLELSRWVSRSSGFAAAKLRPAARPQARTPKVESCSNALPAAGEGQGEGLTITPRPCRVTACPCGADWPG